MNKQLLTALFALVSLLSQIAHAQFGAPKTEAALISEFTTVQPGQTFSVVMELKHEPHWHSYFINDGIGTAIVPKGVWTLPDGWTSSELIFPAPHAFTFNGATVYGYEGTNYFFSHITVPENATIGDSIDLAFKGFWQVCDSSSCLPPRNKSWTLTLNIAAEHGAQNPDFSKVVDYKKRAFPQQELPNNWKVTATENANGIALSISGNLPDDVQFFEYDRQIDAQQAPAWTHDGDTHTFTGKRNQGNAIGGEAGPKLERLRGILVSPNSPVEGSENRAFWIDVPLETGSAKPMLGSTEGIPTKTSSESNSKEADLGVPLVLASLLLGGLILNLMPCVFPVIGLKIMGFVQQAGEDKKKIKLHGIAFTAGVLLSFLGLAAILYPLKATTTLGAQLQEPWVVFTLLVVMLLLALSMAGLFEIGAKATSVGGKLTQKDGISGSFFSGVLAVIIATPCSAPFLGPAIGAAWKFDGPLFFLSLLMMGIGLSLPYITLSFFPALVNKLPRPGAWMESFKQGMSFLLFATVGYLLWIYNAQVGEVGQKGLAIMLGITAIAAAGWVYGRWNTPIKPKKTQAIAKALALAFLAGGVVLAMPPKAKSPEEIAAEATVPNLEWEKWSQEKVDALLAEGKPVYVDFTAKWCLTCQTNKATAYTAKVRQLMHDKGIITLKADMTSGHPEATKVIHSLNRSAIPVNVLYVPSDSTPHVTREVLTADYLLDFFTQKLK